MIIRSVSRFARRFVIALAIGGAAVPSVALLAAAAHAAPAVSVVAAPQFKVVDGAIALHVVERNPDGTSDAFKPSVGALYAWVKVRNTGEDSTITMVWKKEGKTKMRVTLPVGHSWGWKTWSKKGIGDKDAGHWTIEVLDAQEQLLETLAFTVDAGAPEVTSLH